MRKKRLVKAYKSTRVLNKNKKKTYKKAFFQSISIVGILTLTILTSYNLGVIFKQENIKVPIVLAKYKDLNKEVKFWNDLLKVNPDYLPGILELAKIEASKGNKTGYDNFIKKAQSINPNDERVKEAARILK